MTMPFDLPSTGASSTISAPDWRTFPLSSRRGRGRAGGDQRAVFPNHQRPCSADEIAHLSAEGTIRLPPTSNGIAPEDRNCKFALRSPGSQTIEHLQRSHVEEVRPVRALARCFPSVAGGRSQRPEGVQCGPGCAIIASRRDLIGESVSGSQTVSQSPLRLLREEADNKSKPAAIVEQRLATGESPKRKASSDVQVGLHVEHLVSHERDARQITCCPNRGNLPCIKSRIHQRPQAPPRCDTLRRATTVAYPVIHVTRITTQILPRPKAGFEVQHVYIRCGTGPICVHVGGRTSRRSFASDTNGVPCVRFSADSEKLEDPNRVIFRQKFNQQSTDVQGSLVKSDLALTRISARKLHIERLAFCNSKVYCYKH